MSIKGIINIIFGSLLVLSVVVIIILGCVISTKQDQIRTLKIEQNHLSQTIQQLQEEEKGRIEIMDKMQERLEKAEKVKTREEAVEICREVLKGLR